jgi:hypothetical protein
MKEASVLLANSNVAFHLIGKEGKLKDGDHPTFKRTQLDRAKVCKLCPSKPKIWPESKFYAHLKEAHYPE